MASLPEILADIENVKDIWNQEAEAERDLIFLTTLENELFKKVDSYSFLLDHLKADIAFWEEKEKMYKAKRQQTENKRERLKERLKEIMQERGLLKLQGESTEICLQPTRTLEINEELLPQEFKRREERWFVDKEQVRHAVVNGEAVPGVGFVEGMSLRTRASRGKEL